MLLKINYIMAYDNLQRRGRKFADKVCNNVITRTHAAHSTHRRQNA